MSSRNPPPRFARARSVLVGLLAVLLVALYGFAHRAELGQIVDELRAALPVDGRMTTKEEGLAMATRTRTAATPDVKLRKRDTGEQGNQGVFSAVSRGEADIRIPAPGTRAGPVLGVDAQVAASAELGGGVQIGGAGRIGEDVATGEGVRIGEGVVIRDGAQIGAGARIEDDASIAEGVSVGEWTTIRQGVILRAGSAVGDGVELDEEVSVGEAARLGRDVHVEQFTRIGARVTVDGGAAIGEHSVLEDRSTIRHSARLGDTVTIGRRGDPRRVERGQRIAGRSAQPARGNVRGRARGRAPLATARWQYMGRQRPGR